MKDFLLFKKMFAIPAVIAYYIISTVFQIIGAFNAAKYVYEFLYYYGVSSFFSQDKGDFWLIAVPAAILTFVVVFAVLNLSMRLICEFIIVIFRIHSELKEINVALRGQHSDAVTAALPDEVKKETPLKAGRWVCQCGSKNPDSAAFCSKCGSEKK